MKRMSFLCSLALLAFGLAVPHLFAQKAMMRITVDNVLEELWINGKAVDVGQLIGAKDWQAGDKVEFDVRAGKNLIALKCSDAGVIAGLLADITYDKTYLATDKTWKFSLQGGGYESPKFDDSKWKNAVEYFQYPQGIWAARVPLFDNPKTKAWWIWSDQNQQGGKIDPIVFFRFTFGEPEAVDPKGKVAVTWGQMKQERGR